MKKVKFTKRIKPIYLHEGKEVHYRVHNQVELPIKEGTGVDLHIEGLFLDWGVDSDENFGSWTVAIIQLQDGSVELVHPEISKMKFITDACGVEIKHDKEQDELTISNQPHEIESAAKHNKVDEISVHIAKKMVGNNREKVNNWISENRNKVFSILIV